ncbi:single-stranded DNA-binding protein [Brevibacillus sp. MER 51]|uniref:single-stranded DNA-binding protein n=1 Tax=Brevibacillus sp. MER 51 TaxID=2939560 RepID=UPI00203BE1C4|nr:single-stranded DNA-binding protein [Brevibacillus sp. MER 51]MCM3141700.1 single-stranded DNA-binding protein [Brevibacillus sp. MER 51]
MNKVILIGNLTKDPELRYTPNGVAVATFTVAVNRPRVNQQGEKETDFINIVAWQKLADLCASYLRKGRQAAIEGRMQTRSYDNKEGKKVYVTEVVAENVQFLGGGQQTDGQKPANNDFDPFGDPFANAGKPINISDDDLPF